MYKYKAFYVLFLLSPGLLFILTYGAIGLQRTFWFPYELFLLPFLSFSSLATFFGIFIVTVVEAICMALQLTQFEPINFFEHLKDIKQLGWGGPGALVFSFFAVTLIAVAYLTLNKKLASVHKYHHRVGLGLCVFTLLFALDYLFGNVQSVKDSTSQFNPGSFMTKGFYSRILINFKTRGDTIATDLSKQDFASSILLPDLAANENVLIIMMESFGLFGERETLEGKIKNLPDYKVVQSGMVPFQGTTINGEFRELCGLKMTTINADKVSPKKCVTMEAAKNHTKFAFHGFNSSFYSRSTWYPRIGFDKMFFLDSLKADRPDLKISDFPFAGAFDKDVFLKMENIDQELDTKVPRFFYLLTLDSHVPVPSSKTIDSAFDCPKSMTEQVCNLQKVFNLQLGYLNHFLKTSSVQWTVLMVGDHAPPLIGAESRSQFSDNKVPYYLFKSTKRIGKL